MSLTWSRPLTLTNREQANIFLLAHDTAVEALRDARKESIDLSAGQKLFIVERVVEAYTLGAYRDHREEVPQAEDPYARAVAQMDCMYRARITSLEKRLDELTDNTWRIGPDGGVYVTPEAWREAYDKEAAA